MEADLFIILGKSIVLFIYLAICIIAIIFTFAIEKYSQLDQLLNLEIFSLGLINPLGRNVNTLNDWLIAHHRIIGPVLIFLSLLDIAMFLRL